MTPSSFRPGLCAGAALCAALVLGACGNAAGTGSFAVRDSAGIAIAESGAPAWGEGEGWRLAPEPLLDIGAADGPPETILANVRGAARLSDGRVVVADGGSSTVRWYGPDGAFLMQRGGQGGGPEEFQRLSRGALHPAAGDSVTVVEGGRVARFDGAGGRRDEAVPGLNRMAGAEPLGDGRWVGLSTFDFMALESGERRDTFAVLRAAPGQESLDTLGSAPGAYRLMNIGTDGAGNITTVEIGGTAFAGGSDLAARPGAIVLGTGLEHAVRLLDPEDGRVLRIIRWQGPDLAVTDADRSAWREATIASRLGANAGNPVVDEASVRQSVAETPMPPTRPAYRTVRTDGEGNLWLELDRLPGDATERHLVLDPEGRLLGEVAFPERFRTLEIGTDYVLGVWRDDLDVEHVRVHRLVK